MSSEPLPLGEPELLRRSIDAMAFPIAVQARVGRIVFANAAYCRHLGLPQSAVVGRTAFDLFAPDTAKVLCEHDEATYKERATTSTVHTLELVNGVSLQAHITRTPLANQQGGFSHLVCTWQRPQPAVATTPPPSSRPNTRAVVLSQLAGLLAHQIRNPLGAISNALALVRRQLPESCPPITKEALSIAQEEVWVANRAISDLLEYSRIGPPNRTRTSARRVIDLALQGEAGSGHEPPAVTRSDSEHELYVDERQVADAIVKVVRHARDVAGKQSRITFVSQRVDRDVEIIVEVPAIAGRATPSSAAGARLPVATAKPASQTPAIALGLTTAHALIANQGGKLEGGTEHELPLRFRLLFAANTAPSDP